MKLIKKKDLFILFLILASTSTFSQKKERFRAGVTVVDSKIYSEINPKSSILFVFEGSTHYINYYLDVAKLEKQFQKSNHKIAFNYKLNDINPLPEDLIAIPKKYHSQNSFDLICYVTLSDWGGESDYNSIYSKLTHSINLLLVDSKTITWVKLLKLKINSYQTILTKNKKTTKKIYEFLKSNNI